MVASLSQFLETLLQITHDDIFFQNYTILKYAPSKTILIEQAIAFFVNSRPDNSCATLRAETFAGIKFRVFWSFSRRFLPLEIINHQNAKIFSREITNIFYKNKIKKLHFDLFVIIYFSIAFVSLIYLIIVTCIIIFNLFYHLLIF